MRRLAFWMMARGVYYAALLGRPDSGLVYAKKAAHLMEQERMNPDLRVVAMTDIADFYRQTGQLDLSAEGYMQALAVADSFQTTTGQLTPLLSHSIPRLKDSEHKYMGLATCPSLCSVALRYLVRWHGLSTDFSPCAFFTCRQYLLRRPKLRGSKVRASWGMAMLPKGHRNISYTPIGMPRVTHRRHRSTPIEGIGMSCPDNFCSRTCQV